MGTEAAWVPAVIAAVGAGAQAKATDDSLKRQDEVAAQGIRTQSGKQQQADARIAQEVNKLQGSTPEDSQREATDAFMQQLKRTRAQAHGGETVGATSDAYNTDSAQAKTDVDQYGANRAGILGRINAPGLQRTNENISRLRTGTDLNMIARAANGDQFLNDLRMRQIRPDPWLMAGGQVAGGIAGGMASQGGGGTVSKGTVPPPKATYGASFTGNTRGFA